MTGKIELIDICVSAQTGVKMKIISLVPSITETLFALGLDEKEIVGRTPWCIHPQEGVKNIAVVGGTKTPNINKIKNLNPDLVILDREENRKEFYDSLLQLGIQTYVSQINSPHDVPRFLRDLGGLTGTTEKAEELAADCEFAISSSLKKQKELRVIPMIWHEPLMAVSPRKYAGSILEMAGLVVPDIDPDGNGYPVVELKHFEENNIAGMLLSSEPHEFAEKEGISLINRIKSEIGRDVWYEMINGENLTWFGSRTAPAIRKLSSYCDELKEKHRVG